jgi:DNA transformation protein and related proteins
MPVTTEYLEYLRDRLSFIDNLRIRKMFGGAMIYQGELPFALVADDTLYFRVGDDNRDDFEAAGMGLFTPYTDKPVTMPYGEVPGDILEDNESIHRWTAKALDAACASHIKRPARLRKRK